MYFPEAISSDILILVAKFYNSKKKISLQIFILWCRGHRAQDNIPSLWHETLLQSGPAMYDTAKCLCMGSFLSTLHESHEYSLNGNSVSDGTQLLSSRDGGIILFVLLTSEGEEKWRDWRRKVCLPKHAKGCHTGFEECLFSPCYRCGLSSSISMKIALSSLSFENLPELTSGLATQQII